MGKPGDHIDPDTRHCELAVGFHSTKRSLSSDGDEGLHAYEALRVSAFLREGDWRGALTASVMNCSTRLLILLLGAMLTLGPATHATMRLFSLALYVLDVWLLYALGRWLARDTRWPCWADWPRASDVDGSAGVDHGLSSLH